MTHLIEPWLRAEGVNVLQTSASFNQQPFDIHPHQSNSLQIRQLKKEFHLPHTPKFLQQKHESKVIEYQQPLRTNLEVEGDACFTRQPEVICSIMTADCLPVLLTDTFGTFVAAVHCGWRSLFDDILIKTIERINPKHQLLAWFGPCIQQHNYEVDAPFVNNYLDRHPNSSPAFMPVKDGKSFADLTSLAEIQLQQIMACTIIKSETCTYADPNYYSWRENKTTKRMASMIWLATP
jgi:YfiH family protein